MPDDSFKKLPKFREINFVKKKSRFINQSADLVEFFCMSRDAKVAQKMYKGMFKNSCEEFLWQKRRKTGEGLLRKVDKVQ